MSALTEAFADLLDAQEEACGERITATVGSVTADAIVGAASYNEILVAGGVAEAGGTTLQIRADEFDTAPVKLSTVVVRNQTLTLLDYTESHGVYNMVCGDPVANE